MTGMHVKLFMCLEGAIWHRLLELNACCSIRQQMYNKWVSGGIQQVIPAIVCWMLYIIRTCCMICDTCTATIDKSTDTLIDLNFDE